MRVDGVPFALATPRKTLSVLAYFLLNRKTSVSREYLAFALWPDEEEDVVRQRLRANLHDLQRVLPAPGDFWLVVGTDNLAWNSAADVWLDIDEFEVCAGDPARLREAAELYRGELLGALYDEWIVAPRERLQVRYVRVLVDLIADARRRQAYGEAVDWAHRVLDVDPWREDIVRRAMSLRFESGDRAGALAEYRRFADRLRVEMAVEPMPETQALMEAIASGAESTDRADVVTIGAHRSVPSPALPFVGRRSELERGLVCWEKAIGGEGVLFGIAGEAGIGKSRLARELVEAIEERGGRAMRGGCGRPEAKAYEPFVDALRGALPMLVALPIAPATAAVLATLIPELGARLPNLPEPVALDPQRERERIFDALGSALALIAKPRPLVLVFEDLHWAGEATLEALSFVVRRLRGTRSMIVVTYRDEETPRNHLVRRMLRERNDDERSVVLGPLDIGAVGSLMDARLGASANVSAAMLHERAGGNPLFVAQMLVDPDALRSGVLPQTLSALVSARFDALSPEAATVAEVAASVGERFSLDVVRDVLGWSDSETMRAFDALIDRRIVRERSGRGLFPYAFAHQLVQQIIAERLPAQRRVARHRRIACVLDEFFVDHASELAGEIARHYDRGQEHEIAVARYLAATRHAMALGAIDEARRYLDRALELAVAPRMRADLLLAREEIGTRVDAASDQVETLDELERVADACGDDALRCDVLARRARMLFRTGENAAMRDVVEALATLARRLDGGRWIATADQLESLRLELAGTAEEAVAFARRALQQFRAVDDDDGVASTAVQIACICAETGRLAEANAALADAFEAAERKASYAQLGQALFAKTVVTLAHGDYAAMRLTAEDWLVRAVGVGDSRAQVRANGQRASALMLLGSLGDANRTLEDVIALSLELNLSIVRSGYLFNHGILLTKIGDLARARGCFEEAQGIGRDRGHDRLVANCDAEISVLDTLAGAYERAVGRARTSLEAASRGGFSVSVAAALEYLAEAEMLAGNTQDARAHLADALALRGESGSPSQLGWHRAMDAMLAREAGDVPAAVAAASSLDCAHAQTFVGARWPERMAWNVACVLHASGRGDDAARWAERAIEFVRAMRASLGDLALEAAFDALPWRAEIVAAVERGCWPKSVLAT